MLISKSKYRYSFLIMALFALFAPISFTSGEEVQGKVKTCQDKISTLRKYADICQDRCLPQFDKSIPCFGKINYGCYCGDNSCSFEGKCITKIKFSKIYKNIQFERNKKIIEDRRKLVEKMKDDPGYRYYIKNLYKNLPSLSSKTTSIAQDGSKRFIQGAQELVNRQNDKEASLQAAKKQKSGATKTVEFITTTNNNPINNPTQKLPQFYIGNNAQESQQITASPEEIQEMFPMLPVIAP